MPSYYGTSSGYQAKDLIEIAVEPLNGIDAFYTGNMIKYACRWWRKNGADDLKKLQTYACFLEEHISDKKINIRRIDFAYRLKLGNRMAPIVDAFADDFRKYLIDEKNFPKDDFFVAEAPGCYTRLIATIAAWYFNGAEASNEYLNEVVELCDSLIRVSSIIC